MDFTISLVECLLDYRDAMMIAIKIVDFVVFLLKSR